MITIIFYFDFSHVSIYVPFIHMYSSLLSFSFVYFFSICVISLYVCVYIHILKLLICEFCWLIFINNACVSRHTFFFPRIQLFTANPMGVTFSKAQSSKVERLFCHVPVKRDLRAFSFELVTPRDVTPQDWLYRSRQVLECVLLIHS